MTKGRELSPDAANARLAEVYLRQGRAPEAVAAIRNAMAIEPENPRYLEMLGEALEASGGADQRTISELGRIVASQPQNAAAVAMLPRRAQGPRRARGRCRGDTARRLGRPATGQRRDQLSLRFNSAQVFEEAERYDDAVNVYEGLLTARNIKDAPLASERERRFASLVLTNVINLRQRSGKGAEALAVVERLRRLLGNNDPAPDIQAVNLLRSQGKRQEALAAVRAARQRFPEETGLLRLEAFTLADLGRVEEAVGLIRPRLTGGAGDYEEYLVLANLLMNAGRGGEAVEAANKAVGLAAADEPQQATNALLMLSSAQERAGDTKGSEETLRKILAKDPNNSTALNNLGYFLAERNERLNEALEMTQRASARTTNPFLDSLGGIFRLGQLKRLNATKRRGTRTRLATIRSRTTFSTARNAEKARRPGRKLSPGDGTATLPGSKPVKRSRNKSCARALR